MPDYQVDLGSKGFFDPSMTGNVNHFSGIGFQFGSRHILNLKQN